MRLGTFLSGALVACALAGSIDAPAAQAAKKPPRKPKATAPGSVRSTAPQRASKDTIAKDTTARPAPVAPAGHTTIAPFPVPGDTGRDAAERRKLLNVPKPGVNTLVPLTPAPAPGTTSVAPPAADTGGLPKFGDYVYVEELPEAITRVPPAYPDAARKAGVQGVVMVQALIGRDGSVVDTRIVKSIPPLDDAAAAAVRQWRFKPAMAHGQPIAVWVAVPVRFSLH